MNRIGIAVRRAPRFEGMEKRERYAGGNVLRSVHPTRGRSPHCQSLNPARSGPSQRSPNVILPHYCDWQLGGCVWHANTTPRARSGPSLGAIVYHYSQSGTPPVTQTASSAPQPPTTTSPPPTPLSSPTSAVHASCVSQSTCLFTTRARASRSKVERDPDIRKGCSKAMFFNF